MPSVFVLGPSLENVVEPDAVPTPGSGRLGVAFQDTATSPGGVVHMKMLPGAPGDAPPINVYAFYVNPPSAVPPPASRTADWYLKSANPSASTQTAHTPDTFDITVPNVKPGSYHVGTVLEYAA